MKISQKKNCGACRAVDMDNCTLGYPIEWTEYLGRKVNFKPLKPCPKPLTYEQSIEATNNYKYNQNSGEN